ncbi:MAG TPA: hypothetical protein VF003_10850 [Pseudonocardiaceae bacterium]
MGTELLIRSETLLSWLSLSGSAMMSMVTMRALKYGEAGDADGVF